MTCNVCNMLLEEKDRGISGDPEWYEDEKWWVFYDEDKDEYCLHIEYDCGYAATVIRNINYCPLCGRELY